MMSRFVLTLSISRLIRIVCFMVTILPSPKPGCYMRRFPPVPEAWIDFIKIGFQEMMGRGGCNDLIFRSRSIPATAPNVFSSGHCNLWTVTPLLYHDYFGSKCCWLLWLALLQTSIRTVLEHHHYSVDMFLAVVVTTLVWRELEWVCPIQQPLNRASQPVSKRTAQGLTGIVVALLLMVTILIVRSSA